MKVGLIIMLLLLTLSVFSQKQYEIDLSKKINEVSIGLNYTGVKIINKCPSKEYKVKITVEEELGKTVAEEAVSSENTWQAKYPQLAKAYNNLLTESEEKEIPKLIKELKAGFSELKSDSPHYELAKKDIEDVIAKTSEVMSFTFELKKNQNVYVTITRIDKGEISKTWLQILRTPRTVSYISHFGFTFSSNLIKEPENYFSKNSGKGAGGVDSFTVTKLNPNGKDFWKDLSLTANFLVPINKNKNNELSTVNFAWNVGFGVSGDAKFTVYTGPAILLNDFAALGLGFGVSNSYKLKGEYAAGQGLKENLNFDQLHTKGIRPNILLTLSLRLSKKQLQGEDIETVGAK